MATDALRRHFLEFENKYENCTVDFDAACPVVIDFCDASANSKSFSEATVDFSIHKGFPLASFFQFGQRELTSYLLGKRVEKSEAIVRLEDFITDSKLFYFIKTLVILKKIRQNYLGIPQQHDFDRDLISTTPE